MGEGASRHPRHRVGAPSFRTAEPRIGSEGPALHSARAASPTPPTASGPFPSAPAFSVVRNRGSPRSTAASPQWAPASGSEAAPPQAAPCRSQWAEPVEVRSARHGGDDVIIAGYGGSGQALLGNILVLLGMNYVDPYTAELNADGTSRGRPGNAGYRARIATQNGSDRGTVAPASLAPRLCKTHHFAPVFDDVRFGGVWILVRDPRDALYSWYRWRLSFAEEDWDRLPAGEEKETFFLEADHTGRTPIEDWARFYDQWEHSPEERQVARALTRFEDLKSDPVPTVADALARFGLHPPRRHIEEAVAGSTFDAMRAHEDRHAKGAGRIMRQGRVGGWAKWMTGELAAHFAKEPIVSTAGRYGYDLTSEERADRSRW